MSVETLKIPYKKDHLNKHLIFGTVWFVYAFYLLFFNDERDWAAYFQLALSTLYGAIYIYDLRMKYVIFEDGYVKISGILDRKIKLSDLISIKKFAGDYILKSQNRELGINTQVIDPKSLKLLDERLKQLDVQWI